MSPETHPHPPLAPEVIPFLPMLYVAWADGVLTPGELARIRREIRERTGANEGLCTLLEGWLDPEAPPSPSVLEALRERIRVAAASLPDEEKRSLVLLGAAMARKGALERGEGVTNGASGDGLRTLEAVEEVLGILGTEAVRTLLPPEPGVADRAPAPFDPQLLHRFLDGDHLETREWVKRLLRDPALRIPRGLPTPVYRERVLEALRRVAGEGMGAIGFPRAFGGGGDPARAIAVFETLALGDLSVVVKFGVQFGLWGGSVLQLGTERHHKEYLPSIIRLELPGCYAMTERGHGSNVRELETTATWIPASGEFELHTPGPEAWKDWIGNGAVHGRIATVFAQLRVGEEDHGVHAFLVPLRDGKGTPLPGVEIQDCGEKVGLNGVDNGRIAFQRVRIPRESLLNRFAEVTPEGRYESSIPSAGRRFFTMLATLVTGRISVAAAALTASRRALTVAVRYSDRRVQFGPAGGPEVPILDYLTQQRLLLPRLAECYALTFALRRVAREFASMGQGSDEEEEAGSRRVEVLAAGLKALATRHAMETIQAGREACGGRGYLADNLFGALREDVDVFTTFEGANVVLLQLVARGLLTRFRDRMGDLRPWGLLKILADRAGSRVSELNPVVTRRTDPEHLRDPDFHRSAFRYREDRLLGSVARRLKGYIDEGMDSFDAMNLCQDHLVSLAEAHMERVALESLQEAVVRAPSPGTSETLRTLATLYALSRLESDRGWFLEAGYLEPAKSRAIRAQVNLLCPELREHATFLVDAFAIPDELLSAPDGLSHPAPHS